MKPEQKFGTKEWAEKNINLFTGNCENGCIYCYAKANNARYKKDGTFLIKESILNQKFVKKREYLTMFPSTHDIRPENINEVITFLKKFLASGSPILIVSKPFDYCISQICDELEQYKEQIMFRFTVGSFHNSVLEFYEPNAPDILDRLKAIKTAYNKGFKTSLSIEPMLDEYPENIVESLHQYITDDIWIGKMNFPKQRLALNNNNSPEIMERVNLLIAFQEDDKNILEIVNRLSEYKSVVWKESVQKVIDKHK